MSRLKELRLHGFKSFADPTRFVFEPGVNAVIGPNGSGKSNMADAVRWVLGEQSNRSLRTRRADDVIFAGSEQRKAQGMAEAVLTLDNADGWLPIDFAEVSIGRRAYRSGDSEYLINGARARLRDVVELLGEGRLGANELVVVGQGTVDAALSLRPEERRQLFEEAAGVKGLQVRRNEASGRLAKALDNLTRVSDLIAELKPQVRRLALQAEHQQQHDTLGARARGTRDRLAPAAGAGRAGGARRGPQGRRGSRVGARGVPRGAGRRATGADGRRGALLAGRGGRARRGDGRARLRESGVIRAEGRLEALDARLRELSARHGARDRRAGRGTDGCSAPPTRRRSAPSRRRWHARQRPRRPGARRSPILRRPTSELLAAEQAVAELRSRESDRIAAARPSLGGDRAVARLDSSRPSAERERRPRGARHGRRDSDRSRR